MSEGAGPYVISQSGGAYSGVPEFLDSQHQVHTAADAEAYLARVHAMARVIGQETERVRKDAGLGVIAPATMILLVSISAVRRHFSMTLELNFCLDRAGMRPKKFSQRGFVKAASSRSRMY